MEGKSWKCWWVNSYNLILLVLLKEPQWSGKKRDSSQSGKGPQDWESLKRPVGSLLCRWLNGSLGTDSSRPLWATSRTRAPQLTIAMASPWSHGGRDELEPLSCVFLFPVSPAICSFLSFLLLFGEALPPLVYLLHGTACFMLWAFANRGPVDTTGCLVIP